MELQRLATGAVVTGWVAIVGGVATGVSGFFSGDYVAAALGFMAAGVTAGLVLIAGNQSRQ